MILSVASGKGGTGKTTVATNIALSIGNGQFLDCDVEEPNANIFLQATIKKHENVSKTIPKIDTERCDYCGKCAEFCAYNALAVVRSKVLIFPELCHSCGGCQLVCPKNAITWKQRVIGSIDYGKIKGIDVYQGMLNIGESQAVPVIKALKRKIDTNKDVIIDAPPGTSCPVIESISGSDYCLLVTEPTPFGLHDLTLAIEVVKHLRIPFGVVINRDGIGDTRIETYCKEEKIPVLLKIPERQKIAFLYSKGIALVHEAYEWHEMFALLFNRIKADVRK